MDEVRSSIRDGLQDPMRETSRARLALVRFGRLSALGLWGLCAAQTSAYAQDPQPESGRLSHGADRGRHTEWGQAPAAHVREGWLRGERSNGVERFLAIPYAAPPVGEGRWRPPAAPARWRGVRAADTPPPACAQIGALQGQEDCLYLSVLRPERGRRSGSLPVLFWIHGGSFKVGSGLDNDPTRIARDTETIVVMINYRLGQLGFLAHPALGAEAEDALSGQYGLMDQQAALRWVHDNIEAFGGDPERITLAGGSAGGASVCVHLASPTVAGLFAGGAIMSGSCGAVSIADAEALGVAFASAAGCPESDSSACLRAKTVEELIAVDSFAFPSPPVWGGALLPEPPFEAVVAGRAAPVPMLIGGAEHESRSGLAALFPMPEADYVAGVTDLFGEHAEAVLEQYPPDAYDDPFYAMADVISDSSIDVVGPCINRRTAQALSVYAPVYLYEFADDEAPMPPWVAVNAPPGFHLGASHGSDEIYWFDRPQEGVVLPSEAQHTLADTMVQLLGGFVRRGAPSGRRDRVHWPRFDAEHERVLRFDPGATVVTEAWAEQHRCEFWSSLGD